MAKRYSGNMNGERYLANKSPSKKEVHDLDNEKTGAGECQIDEIIKAGICERTVLESEQSVGRTLRQSDLAFRNSYGGV